MKKITAIAFALSVMVIIVSLWKWKVDNVYAVIQRDDSVKLQKMIDKGFSANHVVFRGRMRNRRSVLHYALDRGSAKCAQTLIDNNANLSSVNEAGYNPLMALIVSNQLKREDRRHLFQVLVKSSNVNQAGNNRQTALHLACKYGYAYEVEALLAVGYDAKIANFMDETPVNIARNRVMDRDGANLVELFAK